jgi:hypothetical protein
MEEHVPRGGGGKPPISAAGRKPVPARHASFVSLSILASCVSVGSSSVRKAGYLCRDSARFVLNLLLFGSAPPLRCELLVRKSLD